FTALSPALPCPACLAAPPWSPNPASRSTPRRNAPGSPCSRSSACPSRRSHSRRRSPSPPSRVSSPATASNRPVATARALAAPAYCPTGTSRTSCASSRRSPPSPTPSSSARPASPARQRLSCATSRWRASSPTSRPQATLRRRPRGCASWPKKPRTRTSERYFLLIPIVPSAEGNLMKVGSGMRGFEK
ncbi:hypothetical protein LZ31DRAFT_187066, partial [Colletotrichum somersetense]